MRRKIQLGVDVRLFTYLFIAVLAIGSAAAAESRATQDGFEIIGKDVLCTGSKCFVYPEVCNLESQPRNFNLSVYFETVQPTGVQVFETRSVERLVWSGSDSDGDDVLEDARVNYTTSERRDWHRIDQYTLDTQTQGSSSRNVLKGAAATFPPETCKQFRVEIQNIIGGAYKYDINWLDPIVNSTFYEVGNVSNNTNIWSTDISSEESTIEISNDGKTFMYGRNLSSPQNDGFEDGDAQNPDWTLGSGFNVSSTVAKEGTYSMRGGDGNPGSAAYTSHDVDDFPIVEGLRGEGWLRYTGSDGNPHLYIYSNGTSKGMVMGVNSPNNKFEAGYTYVGQSDLYSPLSTNTWYKVAWTITNTTTENFEYRVVLYDSNLNVLANQTRSCNSCMATHLHRVRMYSVPDDMDYFDNISYYWPRTNSRNTYTSTQINLTDDMLIVNPDWVIDGGSASMNFTCDADAGSPSWRTAINGQQSDCPVAGDSFKYVLTINGSNPRMQSLKVTFANKTANETSARQSIIRGVESSQAGAAYTAHADQQVYIRLANGTQKLGTFDYLVVSANKRYAFNYDQDSAAGFPAFYNISPVFYVWQKINLTDQSISNEVEGFIDGTY